MSASANAPVQPDDAARRVRVSSPAGLLAAVPRLLGYQPGENCLVVVGTQPPRHEVRVTLRYEIPDPAGTRELKAQAQHAAGVLTAAKLTTAVAVGYGPARLADPATAALLGAFTAAGITLTEMLRAQDGRYWSYVCANPACCPPEGTPFDPDAGPVAARLAEVPVLASREALAATIAPVGGEAAESMRRATRRAEARARRLIRAAGSCSGPAARRRALLSPGLQAVAGALDRYRAGERFAGHGEAAWLAFVLQDGRVRDDAWARMDPCHRAEHLRLWTDLTRLARPGYVAPPATLLAFTAWQDGNGALANLALDRALNDAPGYSMAALIRQAVDAGAPPSMARLPMTPGEVAASYDEIDREQDAREAADARRAAEAGRGQADGAGSGDGGNPGGEADGAGAACGDADDAAAGAAQRAGTPV